MSEVLDRAAEAIYESHRTSYGDVCWSHWPKLGELGREKYYAMAQAAIDALGGLTEEIGYALGDGEPEGGEPDAWFSACNIRDTEEVRAALDDGRKLWSRLVSPWTRAAQ